MAKADLYAALKALQPIVPLMQSDWYDLDAKAGDEGKTVLREACPLTQLALSNNLLKLEDLLISADEEKTVYTPLRKHYHVQTRTLDDFVTQWDDWTTPVESDLTKYDLEKLVDELAKL